VLKLLITWLTVQVIVLDASQDLSRVLNDLTEDMVLAYLNEGMAC
jgi:hypothetical protein